MTPPPDEPVEDLDPAELRRLFSEHRFDERAARGELSTLVKHRTQHRAPSWLGEPPGTLSHIVRYVDQAGRTVAMAHEYLRPDGTLGASGRRDPKWLRIEGRIYKQRPEPR
ncbi:MAG: hypothetical protein ACYDEB_11670 [Dehalococcoidia bacterium]